MFLLPNFSEIRIKFTKFFRQLIVNGLISFQSEEKRSSDLYRHIQGDDDYDTHALDSATVEQSHDQQDFKRSFDDSDVDMKEDESDHDDDLAQIDNDEMMVRISKGFKTPDC